MKGTTAVILAAGLGTRMKSETPKVMHKVGDDTILGCVLHNVKKTGITDIVVVVGHKAEEIEEFFKNEEVRFVRQEKMLGSADALRQAVEVLSGDEGKVLVTCGDTPLIEEATYSRVINALEEDEASCCVLTAMVDDAFAYGRILRNDKGDVLRIVEEKDATDEEKRIKEINVGTYCFDKGDIKRFIGRIQMNEKKQEFYLTDIIEVLNENGKRVVGASCAIEESIGINTPGDLAEVNRIVIESK